MVPKENPYNHRGKPNNVGSGTVLGCGPNSFFLIAQAGIKGTSRPVKCIALLNENIDPVKGYGGLTLENLMNCTNQMCWKYPTATKVCWWYDWVSAHFFRSHLLSLFSSLQKGCSWTTRYVKNTFLLSPKIIQSLMSIVWCLSQLSSMQNAWPTRCYLPYTASRQVVIGLEAPLGLSAPTIILQRKKRRGHTSISKK